MAGVSRDSFLLITIDSCRYDTFAAAEAPNLKSIGALHCAMAPGNFTYSSHAAMFVGFTPGVASVQRPFVNPKYGKLMKLEQGGLTGHVAPRFLLKGRNIVEGWKRNGFRAIGTGAVGWFDPETPASRTLIRDFDEFFYPRKTHAALPQVAWLIERIRRQKRPVFAFLNLGETHVPYYYEGAPWDPSYNPCVPFSTRNDAAECSRRQKACVEFIDAALRPLLEMFDGCSVVVCGDHGDCWGEDGLWEHGIHHEKVLEVPLIIRLA